MRWLPYAFVPVAILVARLAAAQEGQEKKKEEAHHPVRFDLAALGSVSELHRSALQPRAESSLMPGVELRIHPRSRHGFVGAYNFAEALFGPSVHIVDFGYSYSVFAQDRLDRIAGALHIEIGPALGFVSAAPPGRDHTVAGFRTSLTAAALLGPVSIGVFASYRAGIPLSGTRAAWEGALAIGLRAGFVFDL